jgi:hypothetical protein
MLRVFQTYISILCFLRFFAAISIKFLPHGQAAFVTAPYRLVAAFVTR